MQNRRAGLQTPWDRTGTRRSDPTLRAADLLEILRDLQQLLRKRLVRLAQRVEFLCTRTHPDAHSNHGPCCDGRFIVAARTFGLELHLSQVIREQPNTIVRVGERVHNSLRAVDPAHS